MSYRNSLKLLIVLLFPLQLFAQEPDVTGLWRGFMYNDTTQQNYRYEIAISQTSKGKLFGYSHTYFILGDKEYHGVKKLKVRRDGDEIITEDDELIVNNYPIAPAKGVHQLNTLILKIKDTVMVLSGGYKTNRTREFRQLTGYVHVERKKDYSQSALVPHLQELGLAKNLSFLPEENTAPVEQPIVMLKPMASEEEEKLIVTNAKKQEAENIIRPTVAPTIKLPPVAATEPPKTETPVVSKPSAKPVEQPVVKTTVPAKTETAVTKPAVVPPKPVPVVVPPPVTKPAETAVVKAPPVKVPEPVVTKPAPVKKPEPVDPTAATDLNKRKIENIQALYFKSDSLQLTLYDNGEVDGDTVSVVMNGVVIMPRVGLTTNAVKKTIYTQDAGDSIQLIMYAETLGTLPPNTGLLIVYDGTDRYEIRFSGDMQKSSAIVFRRKKN
jgi:hypothetical protein